MITKWEKWHQSVLSKNAVSVAVTAKLLNSHTRAKRKQSKKREESKTSDEDSHQAPIAVTDEDGLTLAVSEDSNSSSNIGASSASSYSRKI